MKTKKCKKCIDNLPSTAGKYNITIEGVFTLLPIFMEFDGKEWKWEQLAGYYVPDKTKVYFFE